MAGLFRRLGAWARAERKPLNDDDNTFQLVLVALAADVSVIAYGIDLLSGLGVLRVVAGAGVLLAGAAMFACTVMYLGRPPRARGVRYGARKRRQNNKGGRRASRSRYTGRH